MKWIANWSMFAASSEEVAHGHQNGVSPMGTMLIAAVAASQTPAAAALEEFSISITVEKIGE